jgi:hypothetical protein
MYGRCCIPRPDLITKGRRKTATRTFWIKIIKREGNFDAILRMIKIKRAYANPERTPAIIPRLSLLLKDISSADADVLMINHNPIDERKIASQVVLKFFSFRKKGAMKATNMGAV